MSKFAAGLIGIAAIVIFSYLAYTKFSNPFSSQYTVHAVFTNANGLRPDSLVRIAGVNVGKVSSVSTVSSCKAGPNVANSCSAAEVTMTIDQNGLPIHKDATFYIRPRIFLEGNFFVDLRPGSPSAPTAPSGYTFPIQAGVEPVQFGQVLTSLQADTRHNLQILLQQFGIALKKGGPAFNASIQYWLPAYKYSSIVAHDALGFQPHDLSTWIWHQGDVAAALDANPQALQSLITDFNTTAAAFARENFALQEAVAELPHTLSAAIPAFNALNNAFPPLRAFARALIPGVVTTGPMIDASLPLIHQLRLLVSPPELQGLTQDLSVTIPALAKLTSETIPLMNHGVRPASSCVANDILPWTHLTVPDQNFNASNGFPPRPVYVEGVDFLPGLAGESRNFDANGPYIRILLTGGTFTYSLQPGLFGQSLAKIAGTQPELPPGGKRPPYEERVPCETQPKITSLAAPIGTGPSQVATDKLSPAAKAWWDSSIKVAAQEIAAIDKSQGLGTTLGGKTVQTSTSTTSTSSTQSRTTSSK